MMKKQKFISCIMMGLLLFIAKSTNNMNLLETKIELEIVNDLHYSCISYVVGCEDQSFLKRKKQMFQSHYTTFFCTSDKGNKKVKKKDLFSLFFFLNKIIFSQF